jgi:hypothetical protein
MSPAALVAFYVIHWLDVTFSLPLHGVDGPWLDAVSACASRSQNIDSLETLAGLPPEKLVTTHGNFDSVCALVCMII